MTSSWLLKPAKAGTSPGPVRDTIIQELWGKQQLSHDAYNTGNFQTWGLLEDVLGLTQKQPWDELSAEKAAVTVRRRPGPWLCDWRAALALPDAGTTCGVFKTSTSQ